jgi:hypothetical protein
MPESAADRFRHLYCEFLAHVIADEGLAVVEEFTACLPGDRGGGVTFRFGDGKEVRIGLEPAVGRAKLYHEGGHDWPMNLHDDYRLGEMGGQVGGEAPLVSHRSAKEAADWLLDQVKGKLQIP